jgi:hypothetical protein
LRPQRQYLGRPGSATIDAGTSELAPVTDLNGIPDLSTETATGTAAADLTAIKTNNVGGSVNCGDPSTWSIAAAKKRWRVGCFRRGIGDYPRPVVDRRYHLRDAKHSNFQRNVSQALRYREPSPTPASGASVERNEGNNNCSAVTVIAA